MAWKKAHNGTKHNDSCTMAFGNTSNHDNCPRCNELKAGAQPRKSWNDVAKAANVSRLSAYCFSVPIYHARCTAETNPSCNCGKMSYTD
jgi:hypothetical protein